MTMSPEEICRHYTQAANKAKDIQVLADLNATDKASIRAVLIDGGLLPPDKTRRGKRKPPESRAELAEAVNAALDDGLGDQAAADQIGCCPETVKRYRKKREAPEPPAPAEAQNQVHEGVYARIEQVLAALPDDATKEARCIAIDLCAELLWVDLERRLGVDAAYSG